MEPCSHHLVGPRENPLSSRPFFLFWFLHCSIQCTGKGIIYLIKGLEVGELLDHALLEEELLVEHAGEGEHSEAAVLDLNELAAGEGSGVLAAAKGVEAEVAGGTAVSEHVGCKQRRDKSVSCPHKTRELLQCEVPDARFCSRNSRQAPMRTLLFCLHKDTGGQGSLTGGKLEVVGEGLDEADGEEHLPEAGGGDNEEVVDGGLAVGEHGEGHELLDKEADDTEHANTSVLELGLAEPAEVEVVGEANGVKADVTGEGAIELGGALEEGNGEVLLHLHRDSSCGDRQQQWEQ